MKKILILIALIASVTTSLFAFEWGGMINNNTSISTSTFKDVKGNQSNGISLWFNAPLKEDKSLRVTGEGSYKFNLPINDSSKEFVNILDLSLLKFAGAWGLNGNNIFLNAGRFSYTDRSSQIFSQNSDGLNISYTTYKWSIGLYAGYTGLINRLNVAMLDNLKVTPKSNQLYDLSYGYIPLMLDYCISINGGNAIGLGANYFINTTEKQHDKAYANLTVNGTLANIGTYQVAATVGTENFKNVMMRASLDLSFYAGQFMLISAGVDYTSGKNKTFVPYAPISLLTVHSSPSVLLTSDVIVPRVTVVFAKDNFVATLNEKFVTSVADKFTANGLDSNISIVYNALSDVQLGANIIAYTDFTDKQFNNFGVGLNVNFAF